MVETHGWFHQDLIFFKIMASKESDNQIGCIKQKWIIQNKNKV